MVSLSVTLFFSKAGDGNENGSHRISSNFAIMEAIMAGTYSLKRFLQKTPGTEKHNDK